MHRLQLAKIQDTVANTAALPDVLVTPTLRMYLGMWHFNGLGVIRPSEFLPSPCQPLDTGLRQTTRTVARSSRSLAFLPDRWTVRCQEACSNHSCELTAGNCLRAMQVITLPGSVTMI